MRKIQIIVDHNLVIINSIGINVDCLRFKDKFVFCEINEEKKWIEKEPFEGREDLKDWTEIESFIAEVKENSNFEIEDNLKGE